MMAGFLQKLVTAGTRTLGEFSASTWPVAKPDGALLEISDEQLVAGGELEEEAPLQVQARMPQAGSSPPAPLDTIATAAAESSARHSGEERSTPGLPEAPGTMPVHPASREKSPSASRAAPLRDAEIRSAEAADTPAGPYRGNAGTLAPGMVRVAATAEATSSSRDALAPFKERWQELAQRLRMSHPPPLAEAVSVEQEPPSPRRTQPQGREEEARTADDSPAPKTATRVPEDSAAPALGTARPSRHPLVPHHRPVPHEAMSVPPRPQAVPPQVDGARSPSRAPELVIGNLEVRVVSTPPVPELRSARHEPQRSASGSWRTAARFYLGRL